MIEPKLGGICLGTSHIRFDTSECQISGNDAVSRYECDIFRMMG